MTLHLIGLLLAAAVMNSAQVSPDKPPDKPKDKCRLEGRVTSLSTGEGVRKATLRLRMAQSGGVGYAGSAPMDMSNYTSTSDAEGKFLFEDVEPGRYTLSAERAGFVRQNYGARSTMMGGTTLTLDAGQHLKDLLFKLTPQGVIAGKVTDEDGDPIPNVQIQVYRQVYVRGKKQLQQQGGSGVTADGSFTLSNLAPGRYYVSASEARAMMMMGGPRERPGRKGPEEGYVTTYFPNTIDASAAAAIDIAAGAEIRGIDIRLRKAQVFHIRGKLVDTSGSVHNTMLTLLPKNPGGGLLTFFRPIMSVVRDREGSFEFNNLLPGTYVIQNQPNGERAAPLVVRYEVTIGDQSIEDLTVPLISGPEISGTIKIEGADPKQAQSTLPHVSLLVLEGMNFNTPSTQAKDDGTFKLYAVFPQKYRVSVGNLPDGTYVKSIRFGGQDVMQMGVDLTSGSGGTIEITLSPEAADVAGVVRDSKGDAVAGVSVSLWNPAASPAGVFDPPKGANTDQNGAFRIRNLAPGQYKVVAWEDIEPGLAQDPDFRKRFESQASSLTLRTNSHESLEVKLISKDAIAAESAKLP